MKKYICECCGCRKTATVKVKNGHRICEDHAKEFRRLRRAGKKVTHFYKEIRLGHFGDYCEHDVCTDVIIKL